MKESKEVIDGVHPYPLEGLRGFVLNWGGGEHEVRLGLSYRIRDQVVVQIRNMVWPTWRLES